MIDHRITFDAQRARLWSGARRQRWGAWLYPGEAWNRTRPHIGGRILGAMALMLCTWLWSVPPLRAAELSVRDLAVRPGHSAVVVVSGAIRGEKTFGLTVLVELVPRAGSAGWVMFTPQTSTAVVPGQVYVTRESALASASLVVIEPESTRGDIEQLGDTWPERGSFTAFDTGRSGNVVLNGFVDDNGTFLSESTRYWGTLAALPVMVADNADGVWDVFLSTSVGDSGWEGVPTILIAGTITVARDACAVDLDCDDGLVGTDDVCSAGVCEHRRAERKGDAAGRLGSGDRAGRFSTTPVWNRN